MAKSTRDLDPGLADRKAGAEVEEAGNSEAGGHPRMPARFQPYHLVWPTTAWYDLVRRL
ncbi:hypothetical protein AB5J55_26525 [Streptomyces sp. R11]|uniref:Uncharacterized protein n=1 Tax=Streptomyces sp. R11 TaxID=3238625 RepID=A0AB39N4Y6_9ACTN